MAIHTFTNRGNLTSAYLLLVGSFLLLSTVEVGSIHDIDSVFDESFFSPLEESHFDGCPKELFSDFDEKPALKRKRDTYEDHEHLLDSYTEDSLLQGAMVSPAYDIERNSPEYMPERKRKRYDSDFAANDFAVSSYDSRSDDSWDMTPSEDPSTLTESDSWQTTPQLNVKLPYVSESNNPIGHILSNGIRTTHGDSKVRYSCRACGKDLKGHQHTPTMHCMLPKHESCWQKIAEDMHLSESISKTVYPPQYMEKTEKKDVYRCRKCGQRGSKRKILSHVMGAKCKPLRKTYSNALAWDGIEDRQ